ncbi:hypothetical protein [Rhodococcus sp. UNC363MFTsu5.1]|nr:hypothetical protein [Rhodococcus sp. UNC363MFTsu5.1]
MSAYPIVHACDCGTWDSIHETGCDGTAHNWDDADHTHDLHADQEYDL